MRRHQKKVEKARERRERRAEAERIKFEKYAKWRQMWDDGLLVREIAQELGLSEGSVSVRIVNLRKDHPDWFPLRRPSKSDA